MNAQSTHICCQPLGMQKRDEIVTSKFQKVFSSKLGIFGRFKTFLIMCKRLI